MNQSRKTGAAIAVMVAVAVGAFVSNRKDSAPAAPSAPPAATSANAALDPHPEKATAALMALPELKAWSQAIEKKTGGKEHGAVLSGDAAPRIVDGKTYYAYSFVQNGPEQSH